jgi:hypothetical protein
MIKWTFVCQGAICFHAWRRGVFTKKKKKMLTSFSHQAFQAKTLKTSGGSEGGGGGGGGSNNVYTCK